MGYAFMLNRLILLFAALALGCSLATSVLPAQAQGLGGALKAGLEKAAPAELREGQTDPALIIGGIISSLLGLLGAALLFYLIYGGYKYMTAKGDSAKVTEAIDIIKNAIIGMVIIVLAYAISGYVIDALAGAAGGGQGQGVPE